jgi:hypothetical protein
VQRDRIHEEEIHPPNATWNDERERPEGHRGVAPQAKDENHGQALLDCHERREQARFTSLDRLVREVEAERVGHDPEEDPGCDHDGVRKP